MGGTCFMWLTRWRAQTGPQISFRDLTTWGQKVRWFPILKIRLHYVSGCLTVICLSVWPTTKADACLVDSLPQKLLGYAPVRCSQRWSRQKCIVVLHEETSWLIADLIEIFDSRIYITSLDMQWLQPSNNEHANRFQSKITAATTRSAHKN